MKDVPAGSAVYGRFNTQRPSTQAPYTLAGSPALAVYRDSSDEQMTEGITLEVDADGVTGLNKFIIDTSGEFYFSGGQYDVVLTAGTVDGVSVVGHVVHSFTLSMVRLSLKNLLLSSGETFDDFCERTGAMLYGEVAIDREAGTETFYKSDGTTPAVVITVDADGNRTAVVFP